MAISGKLHSITAHKLEKEREAVTNNADEMALDMQEPEYTLSAGLRVILKVQKAMNKYGCMKLIHVIDNVMEAFDITGFLDIHG